MNNTINYKITNRCEVLGIDESIDLDDLASDMIPMNLIDSMLSCQGVRMTCFDRTGSVLVMLSTDNDEGANMREWCLYYELGKQVAASYKEYRM